MVTPEEEVKKAAALQPNNPPAEVITPLEQVPRLEAVRLVAVVVAKVEVPVTPMVELKEAGWETVNPVTVVVARVDVPVTPIVELNVAGWLTVNPVIVVVAKLEVAVTDNPEAVEKVKEEEVAKAEVPAPNRILPEVKEAGA